MQIRDLQARKQRVCPHKRLTDLVVVAAAERRRIAHGHVGTRTRQGTRMLSNTLPLTRLQRTQNICLVLKNFRKSIAKHSSILKATSPLTVRPPLSVSDAACIPSAPRMKGTTRATRGPSDDVKHLREPRAYKMSGMETCIPPII